VSERRTQGAMLLAVGAMALFLGRSDLTLSYVRAGIRPLLLASGAILLSLGLGAAFGPFGRVGRTAPTPAVAPGGTAAGQGTGEQAGHGVRVAWLLVLPLLVLIMVAPPALGSYAAGQRAAPVAYWVGGNDDSFPPLGQAVGGAVPMELGEFFYRALYDKRRSLSGARVRLLGFVTPRRDGGADYVLARFEMYCCAADAEVVEVAIHGDTTQRATEQWLMIEGHWRVPPPGSGPGRVDTIPMLLADSVTPVAPPRDRYEHTLFGY
jgi:uncharacterized repeat protein (TIGR03943 family)